MKTFNKTIVAFVSVSAAFLMTACSKPNAGAEFVGDWQNPKISKEHILIERNGEGFMVHVFTPSWVDGKMEEKKYPATYKEGLLEIAPGKLGHDDKTDTLAVSTMMGSVEYSRIK
ncbi:hypothetical protein P9281_34720 [Caballeronia sp. LP003]|uniref:hypothetical protein n=1 Tax=Caballeronia sp. LP003 TaxID=3038551 RepID=UPI0028607402|nr:hypothetical protein [Caballeronia sp. LP003]MDR5791703.1 hypothetical protein [Caballeronia sp. LP003]